MEETKEGRTALANFVHFESMSSDVGDGSWYCYVR